MGTEGQEEDRDDIGQEKLLGVMNMSIIEVGGFMGVHISQSLSN